MTDDRLGGVTYHEAGHAVVALAFGLRIDLTQVCLLTFHAYWTRLLVQLEDQWSLSTSDRYSTREVRVQM
jgi:hypothetical protein